MREDTLIIFTTDAANCDAKVVGRVMEPVSTIPITPTTHTVTSTSTVVDSGAQSTQATVLLSILLLTIFGML